MGEEVLIVAKRLLRRALSTVYTSVGFFLVLTWIWGDYIGIIPIAIAYLVIASLFYGHVFRPLIRFRKIQSMVTGYSVNVYKIMGAIISVFGLTAILSMILRNYLGIPEYVTPLTGIIATVLSIIVLLIAIIGSPDLFEAPEIMVVIVLLLSIILYILKPSLVLPVTGASLMGIGLYTYRVYYLKIDYDKHGD